MDTSLYVNLSYQSSLQRRLELIANNIANVNTAGFKGERVMFDDVTHKSAGAAGTASVSFVIDRASYTDFNTGSITQTGNQFDVAVVGEGFLSVETPNGIRYTRDGRMNVSPNGVLVNLDGSPVLGRAGEQIQIPEQAISVAISQSGTISVQLEGEPQPIDIGTIGIFEFDEPQRLEREESGRFNAEDTFAVNKQDGQIQQFAIESSNINPIKEIIKLMELSRAYTQVSKSSSDIHDQKKDSIGRLSKNS
ncbi:MAG: flagellar basal-body rod protein FlgF [Pseudomonadota bacterium]